MSIQKDSLWRCVCTYKCCINVFLTAFVCTYEPTYVLDCYSIYSHTYHMYIRTCVFTIQLVWDYYERVRENDSDMFHQLVEHLMEYGQGRKLLVMQKQYRYVCTYVHDLMCHVSQFLCTYMDIRTYVLYVCTYICMCILIYMYVPTYVHTYTYT